MTTSSYGDPLGGGDLTGSDAGQGSGPAKEAQAVAGTAKDEGTHVASVTKDEAQTVAQEARQQTSNLLDDARGQVEEQTRVQRDRLVGTLRTFTDDLERMVTGQGGGQGMAADLTRQVADRARELTHAIQDRDPGELLDEVRSFARRRPGTFLLGALAAGVVAGRFARGAKDSQSGGRAELSPYDDVRAPEVTGPPPPGVAGADADLPTGHSSMPLPGTLPSAPPPPSARGPYAGGAQ